ncbi:MAG TPA: xanthine dehydrogenase family protein subunit M [Anaerolineales bacterium]|nr:xanthine dehydrogenase family protein subunit M [Anaerolineales bacterium]
MKPAPFEYYVPDSIEQALDLMREHGDSAKLLAGGQSLVPALNFRVVETKVLIDLNRVEELRYIREAGDVLQVGAMIRERELEFDPVISKKTPLLAEVMPYIAHPQIRNRGTLGGSLANADPAAELPVIMLTLGARLRVSKAGGERWVDATNFFTGMFTTDLASDEMLVEIELPALQPRTGWSFMEVAPRAGDYALMGVAALVVLAEDGRCKRARLVYLNAGDGPMDARQAANSLEGVIPNADAIEGAADLASREEINPFGNIHASPDFQRHLARILTRKTLQQAAERAHQEDMA